MHFCFKNLQLNIAEYLNIGMDTHKGKINKIYQFKSKINRDFLFGV